MAYRPECGVRVQGGFVMFKIRASIQTKLLATAFAILAVTGAAVTWNCFRVSKGIADNIGESLRGHAEAVSDRLSRTLFERYGDVQAFAINPAARDKGNWNKFTDDNTLVRAMNDYAKCYGFYNVMMLTDATGKVVAVNSHDGTGKAIDTKRFRDRSYANAAWFKNVILGKFSTEKGFACDGTFVEDVHFNAELGEVYGGSVPALTFSAPVMDEAGKLVGVWHNIADFSIVEEIVQDTYTHMRDSGFKAGTVTLVGADGLIWADYNPSVTGKAEYVRNPDMIGRFNLVNALPAAAKAIHNESGFADTKHARTGEMMATGYAGRNAALGFAGMPWGVLVRVPVGEALVLHHSIVTSLVVGLVISSVLCLVGIGVAIRILFRPIRATVSSLKNISEGEGDLTQKLDESRPDETGELALYFNKFCGQMRDVIAEVLDSASDVAAAATEISANSEQLAVTVREQQAKTNQISAAVEESSSSVAEVARRSGDATSSAQQAGEHARVGGEEVGKTIGTIERISNDVQAIAADIGALGKRSEQIGSIVDTINDIAEQTNLLALNAAIEAARAGEHGRGFAVVADEVRKLAERTQHATGEIGESIQAIQTETLRAVERMNKGSHEVREGVDQARSAGQTIGRIVTSSHEVTDMIKSIAENARQQASAADEISRSVAGIAELSAQFTASTGQTAAATTQLSAKAETLHTLVERFKTNRRGFARVETNLQSNLGRVVDVSDGGVQVITSQTAAESFRGNLQVQTVHGSVGLQTQTQWQAGSGDQVRIGLQFKEPTSKLSEVAHSVGSAAANRKK